MFSMRCRALARPAAWRSVTTAPPGTTRHWPSHGMARHGRSPRLRTQVGRTMNSKGVLHAVASSCIAVGVGPNGTLVESWDGNTRRWFRVHRRRDGSSLASVSCTSAAQCEAVGSYLVRHRPESGSLWQNRGWIRWSNHSESQSGPGPWHRIPWRVVSHRVELRCSRLLRGIRQTPGRVLGWEHLVRRSQPHPTARDGAELFGVSCLKSKDCVAVGGYYPGTHSEKTLVESWNGSSWSITPSPSPEGTDNAVNPIPELDGVSCTKSTACVAVGHYLNSSKVKTLVETGS